MLKELKKIAFPFLIILFFFFLNGKLKQNTRKIMRSSYFGQVFLRLAKKREFHHRVDPTFAISSTNNASTFTN